MHSLKHNMPPDVKLLMLQAFLTCMLDSASIVALLSRAPCLSNAAVLLNHVHSSFGDPAWSTKMPSTQRQCKQAPQRQMYSIALLQGGSVIGKQRPLMPSSQKCPFHSGAFLARTTASSDKKVPYANTLFGAGELLKHDHNVQLGRGQRTCRLW